MAIWREKLFAWMLRNAESAMEFFKLPTNRVVELGARSRSDLIPSFQVSGWHQRAAAEPVPPRVAASVPAAGPPTAWPLRRHQAVAARG